MTSLRQASLLSCHWQSHTSSGDVASRYQLTSVNACFYWHIFVVPGNLKQIDS